MERKYLTKDGEIFEHKTKDGRYIPLDKLEDNHLLNILKFYKKKAEKGVKVCYGFGTCAEDMFYDEDIFYGEAALRALNYYAYEEEAKLRRGHNKNGN